MRALILATTIVLSSIATAGTASAEAPASTPPEPVLTPSSVEMLRGLLALQYPELKVRAVAAVPATATVASSVDRSVSGLEANGKL